MSDAVESTLVIVLNSLLRFVLGMSLRRLRGMLRRGGFAPQEGEKRCWPKLETFRSSKSPAPVPGSTSLHHGGVQAAPRAKSFVLYLDLHVEKLVPPTRDFVSYQVVNLCKLRVAISLTDIGLVVFIRCHSMMTVAV